MPILTAAVTALSLAGTPGLPTWRDNQISAGEKAAGIVTRLGLGATSGRLYGNFTKSAAPPSTRTGLGPFTRLSPRATPMALYGAFTGKSESAEDTAVTSFSVRPVVTMGPYTDVDIDLSVSVIPVARMASQVLRTVLASMTVRPVLTQQHSETIGSGVIPKVASLPVVPNLTMGSQAWAFVVVPSAASVIPALTMESVVTITPVLSAAQTVVPVLNMYITLQKSNANASRSTVMVANPVLRQASVVYQAGEVDLIKITPRRYGRIRITEQ